MGSIRMSGDNWYPKGTLEEPFLPQEIDDVTAAFPASVAQLMPPVEKIPEEFKFWKGTRWNELMAKWFYSGLSISSKFYPREGIDTERALRHIRAILGSFQPKHEYKEASVAYLLSL